MLITKSVTWLTCGSCSTKILVLFYADCSPRDLKQWKDTFAL